MMITTSCPVSQFTDYHCGGRGRLGALRRRFDLSSPSVSGAFVTVIGLNMFALLAPPSHDCGAPLDYGMLESAELDEHPFMLLTLMSDMECCFGSLRAVIQVPTQLVSDTVAAKRP